MMTSKKICGIDPGITGALALWDPEGGLIVEKMPETPVGIKDQLRAWNPWMVIMEDVGLAFPGNAIGAATTFAQHVGVLKGILTGLEMRYELVRPRKWMKDFIVTIPKEKKERKDKIYQKAQRLVPEIKLLKKQGDAVGILWYYLGINKNE